MDGPSEQYGKKRIRIALLVGGAAVLIRFLFMIFLPGLQNDAWRGEMGGAFVIVSLFFFVFFLTIMLVVWFLAYPVLLFTSEVFRLLFATRIPKDQWRKCTARALWPLPYAAGAGAVVHNVYYLGRFGGWPDDVIFGTIANALGAWCCLTIFWHWLKLARGGPARTADK